MSNSEVKKMVLRKNKSGYKVFKEGGKWKSVHKRVAEKKVGGEIKKGYEVHHRDGNPNNNSSKNLNKSQLSLIVCTNYLY